MGQFRPAVRVTDSDGREWELYAYRLELPRGGRLLRRLLVELPRAVLRARQSNTWTIEAVTWLPHETRYSWRTAGEFRRNVLAQIEGQIARGELPPRPTRATYLGAIG